MEIPKVRPSGFHYLTGCLKFERGSSSHISDYTGTRLFITTVLLLLAKLTTFADSERRLRLEIRHPDNPRLKLGDNCFPAFVPTCCIYPVSWIEPRICLGEGRCELRMQAPLYYFDAAFVMKPWCLGSGWISFFLTSFKYTPLLDVRRIEE